MRYYPVNLDIHDKTCLVVGAGEVGERKIKGLMRSGAKILVVSPKATDAIETLASEGVIELQRRSYRSSDLDGKFLVIGATNSEQMNKQISQDASRRGILCNIADRPADCTFVLPAVLQQGALVIAVSTSNRCPALAKRIRKQLENEFGPEYGVLLQLMGAIRDRLLDRSESPERNKGKFERLLDGKLLGLIRDNRVEEIDTRLKEVMGEGFTWMGLMKQEQISLSGTSG